MTKRNLGFRAVTTGPCLCRIGLPEMFYHDHIRIMSVKRTMSFRLGSPELQNIFGTILITPTSTLNGPLVRLISANPKP